MNVSLPAELEKFVVDTVATGRYSSASEVVRTALRILEEEECWKEEMRGRVAKGLKDAAAERIVDGETAMKRIRAAAKSKVPHRKAS
jgi:antitoxin ParD1/3/4